MASLDIQDLRVRQEQRSILSSIIILSFTFHALTLNAGLNQGEPGMGEKGERGLDGLPGIKVHTSTSVDLGKN